MTFATLANALFQLPGLEGAVEFLQYIYWSSWESGLTLPSSGDPKNALSEILSPK